MVYRVREFPWVVPLASRHGGFTDSSSVLMFEWGLL